ncbi:MAG: hypothetical protein ACI867_000443 [Glaciecola sp.]|jgi:hypothetical protein
MHVLATDEVAALRHRPAVTLATRIQHGTANFRATAHAVSPQQEPEVESRVAKRRPVARLATLDLETLTTGRRPRATKVIATEGPDRSNKQA